jgi:uncharacterized protein
MSVSVAPWRPHAGGVALRVRLAPKSSRNAIEGVTATAAGPALKARVRSVPEDGAANAALERLVAEWLGVTRTTVAVSGGGKSRVKTLAVAGDARVLVALLEQKLAALAAK